ncbi:MAG TPA: hypothetical protein VNA69_19560 [Thermoanaerobaculia bacterium]|nr:hypothetical protein [Thermoanaerobaculia bacterium]
MSDPVLAFVLIASFIAALAAASYFKTLDSGLSRDARIPMIAGIAAGFLFRFFDHPVVIGVSMALAALFVRLTGRESEPAEGMTLGAMTGAAAAIPIAYGGDHVLLRFAQCVLAGAVAGYGITFALTHVREKLRQAAIDAVTAVAAIGVAWLAAMLPLRERHVAFAAFALIPLIIVATVFKQWPAIRGELRHEASLGVIDDEDVRATAHPILRLGRAGWHDPGAHREFVRLATKIALRKRQQRRRSEEIARLYQLEVIKLRMQLQDMTSIDRAMRASADVAAGFSPPS